MTSSVTNPCRDAQQCTHRELGGRTSAPCSMPCVGRTRPPAPAAAGTAAPGAGCRPGVGLPGQAAQRLHGPQRAALSGRRGRPPRAPGDPVEAGQRRAEDQREALPVGQRPLPVRPGDGQEPAAGVAGRHPSRAFSTRHGQVGQRVHDQRGEQALPAVEVAVEPRRRHPHVPGDVGQPDVDGALRRACGPAPCLLDLLDRRRAGQPPAGSAPDPPPPRLSPYSAVSASHQQSHLTMLRS